MKPKPTAHAALIGLMRAIIIAKGDKPWARLVAVTELATRQPGLFAGSIASAEALTPLTDDEMAEWER